MTAENYLYQVGSGGVVPELDTNLVGLEQGESSTFEAADPTAAPPRRMRTTRTTARPPSPSRWRCWGSRSASFPS